jgi:hypothetical protein
VWRISHIGRRHDLAQPRHELGFCSCGLRRRWWRRIKSDKRIAQHLVVFIKLFKQFIKLIKQFQFFKFF